MDTVVPSPDVSSQHLAIHWTGTGWTVRDLGSRNGTWVDGQRLGSGEVGGLRPGSLLGFGGPVGVLTFVDDGPPLAFATCGGDTLEGTSDLLALPNADDPVALFRLDPEDGWVLSTGDDPRSVVSGHQVEVGGQLWQVTLPEPVVSTEDARAVPTEEVPLALEFRVSHDEEYVELTVVANGLRQVLPARTYQEILLALARVRLASAELPPADRGWVYTSRLLKMVRMSSNQLYVGVHRARREFEALGIAGGALVERRATTQQLRLGVEDVSVGPM